MVYLVLSLAPEPGLSPIRAEAGLQALTAQMFGAVGLSLCFKEDYKVLKNSLTCKKKQILSNKVFISRNTQQEYLPLYCFMIYYKLQKLEVTGINSESAMPFLVQENIFNHTTCNLPNAERGALE